MPAKYQVTKRYDHSEFSCVFRQWRAESHCRLLHGYALAFKLTFESSVLDQNGWVIDFGSLKPVKQWLKNTFDHTTVIAADDPDLSLFNELADRRLADLRIFDGGVGCEKFAQRVFNYVRAWLNTQSVCATGTARLVSVEVQEHGVNSAIYFGDGVGSL